MVTSTRLDAPSGILTRQTLDLAARDYARLFDLPTVMSLRNPTHAIDGRGWVVQNLFSATLGDEHDYLVAAIRHLLSQDSLVTFDTMAAATFTPRDQTLFEELLATKLAQNPDGSYIPGKIGTTIVGERVVGHRQREMIKASPRRMMQLMQQAIERLRNGDASGDVADALADFIAGRSYMIPVAIKQPIYINDPMGRSVGASVMTIAADSAILSLDALVDDVDSGTGAAIIRGVSGSRPADPDAALTGTVAWNQAMSDPAFLGSVDDTDGTVSATASAVADDSSADATVTVTHFRVSSTNDGATPLDDHFDGNVGTADADMILNTTAIVTGATVSITSYVIGLPQGSGAT